MLSNKDLSFHTLFTNTLVACCFFLFTFSACGGEEREDGLSEFEVEHGIGPVTERLDIGDLDLEMVNRGSDIFNRLCVACHQLDAGITGPALRNITEKRSPEFVMNYILNPREMTNRHPIGQELADQYPGVMAETGLTREQARDVLEYLRAAQQGEI